MLLIFIIKKPESYYYRSSSMSRVIAERIDGLVLPIPVAVVPITVTAIIIMIWRMSEIEVLLVSQKAKYIDKDNEINRS